MIIFYPPICLQYRIKKKIEGDINELEIALDHANKANNEAQKSIKRYQVHLKKSNY